jgi:Mn2+/Fe2+ NRAMP family transporter
MYGWVVPTMQPYAVTQAVGTIGAVIMPHNLYLHSGLVLSRKVRFVTLTLPNPNPNPNPNLVISRKVRFVTLNLTPTLTPTWSSLARSALSP